MTKAKCGKGDTVDTKTQAKRLLFLAIGGILTGCMLIFPSLGFFEWLTLVPAALVLLSIAEKSRYRALWGYGFFFFLCFYLVIYYWFLMLYPLDFIEGITDAEAIFVTSAAWVGLSLLQALAGGFVFLLYGVFAKGRAAERFPMLKPFFIAAVWVAFEWSQTIGWAGVPWGRLALGQSEYLVTLQSASLFGSYFISFLLVSVNFLIAYAILTPKKIKICILLCASLVVTNTAFGTVAYLSDTRTDDRTVKIAAVQGNVSTSQKWDKESVEKSFEVYRKYTLAAAREGADIVLWPETAIPLSMEEDSYLAVHLTSLAREADVTLLAGAFTSDELGNNYNSVLAIYPDGSVDENVYSKRHLVPFGEYLPMERFIKTFFAPLAELMRADILTAGEGSAVFELEGVKIGSLICFDSIYEELSLASVRDGAEFLTISTNDSWFSDSAALDMHNAQAQLRAIENGRCVIRAANTGISSIITEKGEVTHKIEPLEEGYILGSVTAMTHRTLYSYTGNLFVYLCIAFVTVILLHKIYFVFLSKGIDKFYNQ